MGYNIPASSLLASYLSEAGGPDSIATDMAGSQTMRLVFLILLIYDRLITVDLEVSRIWTLPWQFPKFLYMVNRYFIPPLLAFDWAVMSVPNPSTAMCNVYYAWQIWPIRFTVILAQIVIILRVSALCLDGSKKIKRSLLVAYACQLGTILGCNISNIRSTIALETYGLVPGCLFRLDTLTLSIGWIPVMALEVFMFTLTIYLMIPFRRSIRTNATLSLLARDSILYFALMFGVHIMNFMESATASTTTDDVASYQREWTISWFWTKPGGSTLGSDSDSFIPAVMASLALDRMMLSLRGRTPGLNDSFATREMQSLWLPTITTGLEVIEESDSPVDA